MSAVQILDALLVVLAQLERVGEGVVRGHDGPRLAGVLQPQHVAKLMGSNLEKVGACGGWREEGGLGGLSGKTGGFRVLIFPLVRPRSSVSQEPDCLTHVVSQGPRLIVVKVDVTLAVGFWEEGVSKDPTRAIKGEVVSVPIPGGA